MRTCVYSYSTSTGRWNRFTPHDLDRRLNSGSDTQAVYLYHNRSHYELVLNTNRANMTHQAPQTATPLRSIHNRIPRGSHSASKEPVDKREASGTHKVPKSTAPPTKDSSSKLPADKTGESDVAVVGEDVEKFTFHSVGVEWQKSTCATLGISFEKSNGVQVGGSDVPLTPPDLHNVKNIAPDGNCMFRSLSYVLTGSEDHHQMVRAKIVEHAKSAPSDILGHIRCKPDHKNCKSVSEYILNSRMDSDCTWGTDIELLLFGHMTRSCVYSYSVATGKWQRYAPQDFDKNVHVKIGQQAIYLLHQPAHYEVVITIGGSVVGSKPKDGPPSDSSRKRARMVSGLDGSPLKKKSRGACNSLGHEHGDNHRRYNPVDDLWQRSKCAFLGLRYVRNNGTIGGWPNEPLNRPDIIHPIRGDGNCLFRAFSHIITGSQDQYQKIRDVCIAHLHDVAGVVDSHGISVRAHAGGLSTMWRNAWRSHACTERVHMALI